MGLFDSGIVNFVKLLIIVGLISMLYMVVMQKIKEQNHKITSMLSLITTMAGELTQLKEGSPVSQPEAEPIQYEKIYVSDDDNSSNESESDDEFANDVIELSQVEPFESEVDPETELEFEDEVEPDVEPETEPQVEVEHGDVPEKEQIEIRKKKMSVNELIEIAVDRGIPREECQKLKKKELLELLR